MADYEVEILVRGKPVKMFNHKGDLFIEGRKGSKFELRFTNNTWINLEVVPSVDGLSTLDGEACGESSEGYLVPSKGSITIPGWRLNNDAVAEFVFQDKQRSYASQTGEGTTNVGVIGFMVFKEMEYVHHNPVPYRPPYQPGYPQPWDNHKWIKSPPPYVTPCVRGGTAVDPGYGSIGVSSTDTFSIKSSGDGLIHNMSASVGSAGISSETNSNDRRINISNTALFDDDNVVETLDTFNIGTGWGDEMQHKVSVVDFTRRNPTVADTLIAVYYDTRKGLEARGIKVVKERRKKKQDLPNAFPTYASFCIPPKGWNGKKKR